MSKATSDQTVGQYLDWASHYFDQHDLYYGHGTNNSWDEAVMLMLYVLNLPADVDPGILEQSLSNENYDKLHELAERRVQERRPVPYLTNEAWFAGERYYVNENVIIPRSPLAETISEHFQPWLGDKEPQHILDLCTGSGCLAIYTAQKFPAARVDAVDISKAALEVAAHNIKLHNCVGRVTAIESDLFTALQGRKYDIILSNPPYVATFEMQELPPEYRYEPQLALESGADGLDITRKILQQALNYLTADGILIVELGNSWQTLDQLYPQIPFTWLEFAHGGEGVFLLTAQQLREIKL